MHFKSAAFLGLLLVVVVQAEYKLHFTKTAKDCMTEIKIDEDTARTYLTETGIPKTENTPTETFLECCMRTFITDTNELIIDDKFTHYFTEVFTNRLDGRRNLATILCIKCMEHCKDTKDTTKGKTAFKTFKCMMTKMNDYVKKETE